MLCAVEEESLTNTEEDVFCSPPDLGASEGAKVISSECSIQDPQEALRVLWGEQEDGPEDLLCFFLCLQLWVQAWEFLVRELCFVFSSFMCKKKSHLLLVQWRSCFRFCLPLFLLCDSSS